ncbi:MAG: hypothetical protein ACM3PC_00550 [Deltaproteobacteria bacterium]
MDAEGSVAGEGCAAVADAAATGARASCANAGAAINAAAHNRPRARGKIPLDVTASL